MVRTVFHLLFLTLVILISTSCRSPHQKVNNDDLHFENMPADPGGNVRLIFYNMYLPPEMARIFESVGANYLPSILSEPDDFARYQEPHKIAMNLGIYGVDLSYARMYDQKTLTARYLSTVDLLATKLGIPQDYYENFMNGIEKYYDNRDSVAILATAIYAQTDEYLKKNNNESYAALIIAGGWIEALFISTRIIESEPGNVEISDRIAEQKYSLNSLISLLSNYQNETEVAEVLLMLKRLKKSFDRFEIYYGQDDFVLDTVKKVIEASEYESGLTAGISDEISRIVSQIRTRIIN